MRDNIINDKSIKFSIRIINLYRYIRYDKDETVMSKQLLRSGTSIGANITEALYGSSKKDFLNKMYIAYKECKETEYWLKVLYMSNYLDIKEYNSINNDCLEIGRILSSITYTTKKNIK